METKLRTDVVRLNEMIALYLADGGSLDGLTTAQSVIDKLKTVRTNADAKRQVGALTGRSVDVRLTARNTTTGERAGTAPRAVWNISTKRFDLVTTPGTEGIADFVLDDEKLTTLYPTESRTRTTMVYNDNNGWVWSPGNHSAGSLLNPMNATLTLAENVFDPTVPPPVSTTSGSTTSGSTTSGSTSSGSTTSGGTTSSSTTSSSTTSGSTTSGSTTASSPTTLPKPAITPVGGTFTASNFPSAITISNSGAPANGSSLKYRINNGTWIVYTGSFTINSGDKVDARNFTTNATLFNDSSSDSETYYRLATEFQGTISPTWTNVGGGANLDYTADNNNPNTVVLSHGDTRLDLGGGQYLDAGVENTLTFKRTNPIQGVQPNTDFTLGELIILNGTTFNDSEATSAALSLAINLSKPNIVNTTVPVNVTMTSTANTSDRLASADTVTISNPTTSFTVTSGGITYTLQVRLVSLDPDSGVVTGNTFFVYEGASARAGLIGKFVSNR